MDNLGIASLQKKSLDTFVLDNSKCSQVPFQTIPKPTPSASGLTKKRRRPPYSYTALIAQAILASDAKQLTLREIYDSINRMYPQICQGPDIGWQNTIRHNLSLNQCFKRIPRHQLPPDLSIKLRGKGSYWTVDVELMDPSTRKRLEEAIELNSTAPNIQSAGTSFGDARAVKRPKYSQSLDSPASYKASPEGQQTPPLMHSAHSMHVAAMARKMHSGSGVPYISPVTQCPSPYFQSSLSSPIVMPAMPPKHIKGPIGANHVRSTNIELPPPLPHLPSAQQSPAQSIISTRSDMHQSDCSRFRCTGGDCCHKASHSVPAPVPYSGTNTPLPSICGSWEDFEERCSLDSNHSSAIPRPLPTHNSFGAAVSCARSTVRPALRQGSSNGGSRFCIQSADLFEYHHNHHHQSGSKSALSSTDSYQSSSRSLSPASTVVRYKETLVSNDLDSEQESAKISINDLLN
ncbi:hypothetical protein GGI12_000665 [Dipsacomyces acuminosporus]|nr:hypothetical protein GGI12_000665 [Dipsacomyces acuminosporus]